MAYQWGWQVDQGKITKICKSNVGNMRNSEHFVLHNTHACSSKWIFFQRNREYEKFRILCPTNHSYLSCWMDLLQEQPEIFEFLTDTKYNSKYNNYLNVPLIYLRKKLLQFIMEAFLTASWCIWKQTIFS